MTCARDQEIGCSQKRDLGAFKDTSLFGYVVWSRHLFFYTKKEKEKISTHYIIKILHCHWLNKEKYNFGKLTLQGFGF